MKTATKSSWSKVTQGLYGRWFVQREKAAEKETNKHKNGSLSPSRISYFLPNLRHSISKFSNFSSKLLSDLQESRENIRSRSMENCCTPSSKNYRDNSSISQLKKKRRKEKKRKEKSKIKRKCWELLDLVALTSSPSWMETSFALAFCYKGGDGRDSRHRGQCLMATSPPFPTGLHVSKR